MHRIMMMHRTGDPVRVLINEFNKLRNACAAEGIDVSGVQVIADQNGKDDTGAAVTEDAVAAQ